MTLNVVTIAGLGTANVNNPGSSPSITVEGSRRTVRQVVKDALEHFGRPSDDQVLETLEPVVNGEDADYDDTVEPGDHVAVAPQVANGRR